MDKNKLETILKNIKEDILVIFKLVMEDDRFGTNHKVGINTLKDSRIHDESEVKAKGNLFELYYNDYLDYVQYGRKPKARKVPIKALIEWNERKHLGFDNNILYAIRESIYKQGIKARPILSIFTQNLDSEWEHSWSDKIMEEITKDLNAYFNA